MRGIGQITFSSRQRLQNNLYNQVQLMKRPQSAKPGYRGPALQNSSDDIREEDVQPRHANRRQVKLHKPDLTTNDFARIMPKKIFQDKERLYSEGLQLKQKLNQYQEENVRLKTRISILEKEKDKLSKVIDTAAESSNKSQSRFKMYQGPGSKPANDSQNTRVRNLTKIIRQSKQQNEYLKQENAKIKKAVKFTKINQVEIECKILREEYHKLEEILVDMNEKLAEQEEYEREIDSLKTYLEEEVEENKGLAQSNQKYVEYIQELEDKLKKQGQKYKQKQLKMQRQIALHKRKLNQAIRISDDLRKELRALKETSQNVQAKKKQIPARNITRPMTSNPYTNPENKQQPAVNFEAQVKLDQMKAKNQKLQKELKEVKLKLEKSEKENHGIESKKEIKPTVDKPAEKKQKPSSPEKHDQKHENHNLRLDSEPKQDYGDQDFDQDFVMSPQKNKNADKQKQKQKESGGDFILKEETKVEAENEYFDQFEEEQKKQSKPKKQSKKDIDSHVANYKKDFEEQDAEEEQLYKKDPKKDKRKKTQKDKPEKKGDKKQKSESKKQDKKQTTNPNYQPDKKVLNEIKQLLTYRMKAQRYLYDDLKNDIIASKEITFSYTDLQSMMKTQPFYLTPGYTKAFLEYVFERKDKNIVNETVSTQVLLTKLRKVIKNFQLLDEKQQEQHLMSIAEMTTQYPNELQSAFQKIKNGPDTVAKADLIEMFKKLQLADHFIQIIISQLSLCSQDLQHLSIRGYFQRFYIDDVQNSNSNAIDQQAIESSGEQKSNRKSNTNTNTKGKINKIDEEEEYDDDKVNFIMEDEGEISMKGKAGKNVDYNEDVISDDGHI